MKKQQSGFTLIELMIVVAIIGILASIALPAYQDYIAKSQVAEASVILGAARTAIEDEVSTSGNFPADTDALTALGIKLVGTNGSIDTLTDGTVGDDAGSITFTMNDSGVNKNIQGKKVTFERTTETGAWTCTSDTGNDGLAQKFMPKGCNAS